MHTLLNKLLYVNNRLPLGPQPDNSSFCKGAALIDTQLLPFNTSRFDLKSEMHSVQGCSFPFSCTVLFFLELFMGVLKVFFSAAP